MVYRFAGLFRRFSYLSSQGLIRRFSNIKSEDISLLSQLQGVKNSKTGLLAMFFNCNVCKTRSSKTFSKDAYQTGVVIVRCDGCKAHHLVADHLGWFRDNRTTIEDIMHEKGKNVRRIDNHTEVLEFINGN